MSTLKRFLSIGLLLMLVTWPLGIVAAQDSGYQVRITQVDNSKFPQVTVYVSVTNAAGEPVGVEPTIIQLFENGQLMQVIDIGGGGQGDIGTLTTLLVIDVSGSMEKSGKMDAAKEAAKAYVNQMRPGDQAGLIAFDTKVKTVQSITADHQALIQAIDSLRPSGNTAMFDALVGATQSLEGVSGRKAVILLSDGLDNRSQHNVDDVINAIGPSGLSISTVGLGDPKEAGTNYGLDEPALRSLAERAGGVYSFATAPEALRGVYEQRGRALQGEYRLTYVSPSPLRDGVNRNLSISLTGIPATAEGKYNPGGVLPEVPTMPTKSWMLFGGILLGLLALLVVPLLVGRGMQVVGGSRRKGRIKLNKPADSGKKPRIRLG